MGEVPVPSYRIFQSKAATLAGHSTTAVLFNISPRTIRPCLCIYNLLSSMKLPPIGYQWDPAMDARCHEQYAFGFHDVVLIFHDPDTDYLVYGPILRDEEERFVAIGRLAWGTVVAAVYTMREGNKRLIWVRPARVNERAAFNRHNGLEG